MATVGDCSSDVTTGLMTEAAHYSDWIYSRISVTLVKFYVENMAVGASFE